MIIEACGRAHTLPVFGDECSGDGNGPVMLYERVQPRKSRKEPQQMIRCGSSRKVVNEPPAHGVLLHPLQKVNDVVFGEMVSEESADDEIDGLNGRVREYVGRNPADAACRRSGFSSDGHRIGIDVDAGQFDVDAARASPALDAPQPVAVTAADVEDADRPGGNNRDHGFKPFKRRPVPEKPAVESRNVAEARAQFVAPARLVDQFSELRAVTEVKRVRRHGKASFPQ